VKPADTNESDTDVKIIYYDAYHAAQRHNCSCGNPKWHMFESKCGSSLKIEHRAKQLEGDYGIIRFFYKPIMRK
jgi:histidinol phosphatase-like enzyme